MELRLEVVLRGLHQGHLRIGEEAQRAFQEPGKRHEVAVEDGDELGAGVGQGMVEVARLAVGVAFAAQIVHAKLCRQRGNLGPVSVIEHGDRAMGIAEVSAGEDRPPNQALRLVVGGDPHIHRWGVLLHPRLQLIRLAAAQARIEAQGGQQLQAGGEEVEQLSAEQQHAAGEAQGVGGVERGGPPEEVAQRERHQHQFDHRITPPPPWQPEGGRRGHPGQHHRRKGIPPQIPNLELAGQHPQAQGVELRSIHPADVGGGQHQGPEQQRCGHHQERPGAGAHPAGALAHWKITRAE